MNPIPSFDTDADAGRFVQHADMTEYDISAFRPTHFEWPPKAAQLNMRLPQSLLDAIKETAAARGLPYTRFIRDVLERAVGRQMP